MTTTPEELRAEDKPMTATDWSLLMAVSMIWGSSFLFMAVALDDFEPGLVTVLRVGLGFATLACLPAARQPVPHEAWPRITVLGFTWMAFPLTLFPIAQQWISSSMTGMLNSAMPIAAVLIAWLGFGITTGPRRLAGVAVGIVGILIIGVPEASTAGTNAIGVGLVLVAVTSYGVAASIAGPLQREFGAVPVVFRSLGVALVLCLPYGLIGGASSSFAWSALGACAAIGIGGTGIAFAFAATLNGRVGAVRMSLVTYIIPVVSIVLGVGFRDETVSAWAVLGTVVVLSGAFLSSRVD